MKPTFSSPIFCPESESVVRLSKLAKNFDIFAVEVEDFDVFDEIFLGLSLRT